MGTGRPVRQLFVRTRSRASTVGQLTFGNERIRCALGRSGIRAVKREGDGATPRGVLRVVKGLYRPDRMLRPRCRLPLAAIRPDDGWCDQMGDRNYNRFVRHPYAGSAERLWRPDELYDIVVVLDYNDRPRAQGRGSALFLHVARDGLQPTAGCIALAKADLLRLLPRLAVGSSLHIC